MVPINWQAGFLHNRFIIQPLKDDHIVIGCSCYELVHILFQQGLTLLEDGHELQQEYVPMRQSSLLPLQEH